MKDKGMRMAPLLGVFLGVSLLLGLSVMARGTDAMAPVASITMSELYSKFVALGSDEVIVDTRSAAEYAEGHVPGSRLMPHQTIEANGEELRNFKTVYVYCKSGRRAGLAVNALQQKGLTNLVLVRDSGMPEWVAKAWPVERGL